MSDPSKPQGSYPIMANPDVVLQSVRGAAGHTTKLSSIKTRDTAPAEALQLTLDVVDVRDWLRASYAAEGLRVPERLTGTDFDQVPGSNANSGVPPQFTSLVVASGIRAAEVTVTARTAKLDADRELVRRVIVEHADRLSKTAVRDKVPLAHERTDELLLELEQDGAISVKREGRGHSYGPPREAGAAGVGAAA